MQGIAFDSLRGMPIRNAFVAVMGRAATAVSDDKGRFTLDSIPPGAHVFAMQHALLDSLGFSGITTRATVTDGVAEVTLAVPSFATLWRTACGTGAVPGDSGFVYGTVRNSSGFGQVANVDVSVSWTDMVHDRTRGVVERVSSIQTRTDNSGGYTACGVPTTALFVRVHARGIASSSGRIALPPGDVRVFRRDLLMGSTMRTDSADFGIIAGVLTDHKGDPFVNARIMVDDLPEIRSGPDGRFLLRRAPVGTRQVDIRFLGMPPVQTIVDVIPNDTVIVALQLPRVTSLDGVRVEAARGVRTFANEFASRRREGKGHTLDSTDVAKYPEFVSAFRNMAGLRVESRGAFSLTVPSSRGTRCTPELRIDGVESNHAHLIDIKPTDVAGVEVFNRAFTVPSQYAKGSREPLCGLVLVWTKYGFRTK